MKTTTLFLAIIMATFMRSQTAIQSVTPDACPGSPIEVKFTWDNTPGATNFVLTYVTTNTVLSSHIWSKNNSDFYSLQKEMQGADTLYVISLPTQAWWPLGYANIRTNQNDAKQVAIYCGAVGIDEISYELQAPTEYFTIDGRPTSLHPGEVLIQKTGRIRKKILILE